MWLLVFVFEHFLGMLMNTCESADVFLEVDLCERQTQKYVCVVFILQEKNKDSHIKIPDTTYPRLHKLKELKKKFKYWYNYVL